MGWRVFNRLSGTGIHGDTDGRLGGLVAWLLSPACEVM